ncbi:MAG: ornithine cyclodeaminase family protein, partial [Acidobacteriota bacterium]
MAFHILTDAQLTEVLPMKDALEKLEKALAAKSAGAMHSPARFRVEGSGGDLVFTGGATTGKEGAIGFRVYETFPPGFEDRYQVTAVWDNGSGAFLGLVVGGLLGSIRTGALGGLAVKYMARRTSRVLALLGSGLQARWQLEAALCVHPFQKIKVYSPTSAHRKAFASEMAERHRIDVKAVSSVRAAIKDADVIISATRSEQPLFQAAQINPGVHISTLGPKAKGASELPPDLVPKCRVIATDSLNQVEDEGERFFMEGASHRRRMVELSDLAAQKTKGRVSEEDITVADIKRALREA